MLFSRCGLTLALLLLVCSNVSAQATPPTIAEQIPREIAATGDSWLVIPPDHLQITAAIEILAANAGEAAKQAKAAEKKVADALTQVAPGAKVTERDLKFSPAGGKGGPLAKDTQVQATLLLAIESEDVSKRGEIIDSALASGVTSIVQVESSVQHGDKVKLAAAAEATTKAKEQAQKIAESLGVKLGKLLSATVSEEPANAAIALNRQLGKAVTEYSDEKAHIYSNVRFEVEF